MVTPAARTDRCLSEQWPLGHCSEADAGRKRMKKNQKEECDHNSKSLWTWRRYNCLKTYSVSTFSALSFFVGELNPFKSRWQQLWKELEYCKSRIFRTHSIFVSWALRRFVRMKFPYSRWPLRILWLALYLSHAFYFRTEAAAYEIYENNMHTKYSGFTILFFSE